MYMINTILNSNNYENIKVDAKYNFKINNNEFSLTLIEARYLYYSLQNALGITQYNAPYYAPYFSQCLPANSSSACPNWNFMPTTTISNNNLNQTTGVATGFTVPVTTTTGPTILYANGN